MNFRCLASRNLKELLRDPLSTLLGLGLPAMLALVFLPIMKNAIPGEGFSVLTFTPTIAVFGFAFLTTFSSILIANDRQSAFLSRLLTTPLRPSDFIFAYALPFIPLGALQVVICFSAAAISGFPINGYAALAVLVLLPIAVLCIGIGMMLGSLLNEKQAPAIASMVMIVIGLTGGLYVPLDVVGGVIKDISYALPFAHAVNAALAVINGAGFGDIAIDLVWVIAYSIAFFVLGVLFFRWKTKG